VTLHPPPMLARRVAAEVAAFRGGDSGAEPTSADTYLNAAEALFARLLREGCASRDSAVDLLVVDALVTYAFEVEDDDPARIEARAERAMARLAAAGSGTESPDP
jgi:hypothetical protein